MKLIQDIINEEYDGSVLKCQAATGTFNAQLYRWIKMRAVKSELNDNVYRKYKDGAIQEFGKDYIMTVHVKIGTFHKDK